MNSIKCPNCGKQVEISKAISHQIQESILAKAELEHKEELEKQRKEIEEKAEKRVKEELELKFKDSQNELEEAKKRKESLQDDVLEYSKQIRLLKEKDRDREQRMQDKLLKEEEIIRTDAQRKAEEENRLKLIEKDKQLQDALKANEEMRRKLSQGSQQTQGEVLELELENLLHNSFPQDEVEPVAKGVPGADIRQIVKSPRGIVCGVILWELKRTKEWQDIWLIKLKKDLRTQKANIPVIVSTILPKDAKDGFGNKDGVFICSYRLVLPIAALLRKNLLELEYQKLVSANREDKADLLYSYIINHEFKQQLEILVESYKTITEQIAKERMVFEKSWKQRETEAQRIIMSVANIVGNIQGKIGASMLTIKGMELEDGIDNNQQNLLEEKT